MVLSPDGMRELRSRISFTQLRFHCHKQQHGRTFHVKTAANSSGEAVARFFAGDTDVFPKACGSFEKLKGDNSILASRCVEWGRENGTYRVEKWGHEGQKELYIYSAFIVNTYHWITWPSSNAWQCDDSFENIVIRWLLENLCPLRTFLFLLPFKTFNIYFWDTSIRYCDLKSLEPFCIRPLFIIGNLLIFHKQVIFW